MSCPHSLQPGPCSQCTTVEPRRVTISDGMALVDGEPERASMPRMSSYSRRYRKAPR